MKNKVLQFGEGNFLRCFTDWMVQRMNDRAGFDGAVRIIQPRGTELNATSRILNERGGRYHTCLRGIVGGKTVEEIGEITCVKGVDTAANVETYATDPDLRFVFSNTTEAGIQYVKGADTFPAKVLRGVLRQIGWRQARMFCYYPDDEWVILLLEEGWILAETIDLRDALGRDDRERVDVFEFRTM
jgi:hypothetical protein